MDGLPLSSYDADSLIAELSKQGYLFKEALDLHIYAEREAATNDQESDIGHWQFIRTQRQSQTAKAICIQPKLFHEEYDLPNELCITVKIKKDRSLSYWRMQATEDMASWIDDRKTTLEELPLLLTRWGCDLIEYACEMAAEDERS